MHPNEHGPTPPAIQYTAPEPTHADDEIDLRELFGVLLAGKWLIAGITLLCMLAAVGYALLATPIYQADALLQVEQQSANPLAAMEDLGFMAGKSPADTEIQILRSRSVVGKVVDRLHLTVAAEPKHAPLIGSFIARRYSSDQPAEPWLGLDSYAWGGERIRVPRFVVPESLIGEAFTLVAGAEGAYRILDPEGNQALAGRVGEEAVSDNGRYGAFVSELTARPGTEFKLVSRSWLGTVTDLQQALSFGESGKSTGIIRASLKDADPRLAETILQSIADIYLRQNVERRSAQAEESLRFLEGQLPELRAQLEAAEEELNAFRQRNRAVDLAAEAESVLEQMVEVESQLAQIELKRAELSKGFKPDHPRMQALNEQRAELERIKARLEQQITGLPETQQEILRLSRQVEVGTELYTALLNKTQELRVIKAGTVGNVRILDTAVAGLKPVEPKKALIVALGSVLGLMLSVMLVYLRHAFRRAIGDPAEIERELGLSVYAAVPYSDQQHRLEKRGGRGNEALLAAVAPQDLATESLRSFRTSLHFAMLGAKSNRILLTGPAPGIGKSFVSANTAYLLGESGKSVLLIDADMRRGLLHEVTGGRRAPGLSDVLGGQTAWETSVRPLSDNCALLPAGTVPPNPSELLMSKAMDKLLDTLSARFDYIVIDTPPILAVTDAAVLAAKADVVFLVARAGSTELGELELSVRRLAQNHATVSGVVVNGITRQATGYSSRYYQYAYQSQA